MKIHFLPPHLIQLFDRYATYNGSNPYQTSGIMTLIQHLENNFGTFVPAKGMISITESIYNLAVRLGVEFYFDTPVSEIITESNKVKGIKAKNSFIDSDIVISNMDIYYTYNKLLPDIKKLKIILKQERSSSAVIFYWGILVHLKIYFT